MHRRRAEIFKVLSVESRLKIIELLKLKGPLCVNDLADALDISASAVSQHLKILKHIGIVRDERKGYWIPYDIQPIILETCGEMVADVCCCDCCSSDRTDTKNEADISADKLDLLKEYEKELQLELDKIQARIKALKKKG